VETREIFWTGLLAFIGATVLVSCECLVGCGATSQEPCTQRDLAVIVAAHEARLASRCVGQGPSCPERKAEDARFKEEVRTWVRCDSP
jgi:hypothetical protein